MILPCLDEVWHFDEVVPPSLCARIVPLVLNELERGEQERPFELIENEELKQLVTSCQESVFACVRQEFDLVPWVPEDWNEVVYIRQKLMYQNTRVHQDREFFLDRGYFRVEEGNRSSVAFTWWVGLTPPTPKMSQLRFWGVEKGPSSTSVQMQTGDALMFSSEMFHSASIHGRKEPRVSIDGRFLLRRGDALMFLRAQVFRTRPDGSLERLVAPTSPQTAPEQLEGFPVCTENAMDSVEPTDRSAMCVHRDGFQRLEVPSSSTCEEQISGEFPMSTEALKNAEAPLEQSSNSDKCVPSSTRHESTRDSELCEAFFGNVVQFCLRRVAKGVRSHCKVLADAIDFVVSANLSAIDVARIINERWKPLLRPDVYDDTAALACVLGALRLCSADDPSSSSPLHELIRIAVNKAAFHFDYELTESYGFIQEYAYKQLEGRIPLALQMELGNEWDVLERQESSDTMVEEDTKNHAHEAPRDRNERSKLLKQLCVERNSPIVPSERRNEPTFKTRSNGRVGKAIGSAVEETEKAPSHPTRRPLCFPDNRAKSRSILPRARWTLSDRENLDDCSDEILVEYIDDISEAQSFQAQDRTAFSKALRLPESCPRRRVKLSDSKLLPQTTKKVYATGAHAKSKKNLMKLCSSSSGEYH